MQLDFLTPRVERLSADGRWTTLNPGGALGRLRPTVVLIDRELASFALFESGNLPRTRRGQAARLFARTGSPYLQSQNVMTRAGADHGVWWWDSARVAPLVEKKFGSSRPTIRPETLGQPSASGWRIVKLAKGYEAQRWQGGKLVASAWRREAFAPATWQAFVRGQRGAVDAPETPPPAQSLPLDYSAPAFALSATDISREQLIGSGVGALALASIGASLFLYGQGLKLSSESEAIEAETAEIRASIPRVTNRDGMEENKQKLAAYAEIEARTSPLSAAGAAIGIVAFHELNLMALDTRDNTIRLTLPISAVNLAETLVDDFETSGYFYDVRPRADRQAGHLIVEMLVRETAPPLSTDG